MNAQALQTLMQRQLPQITQRLHQTLEKLQAPQTPQAEVDGAGGLVFAEFLLPA